MRLHNIFRSEIRYQLKNIVFWVFIIVSCLFAYMQFNEEYGTFQTAETDSGLTFQYGEDGVYHLTPEEEAAANFNFKVNQEGLTNAYGRLFADYLGITAGLFPVFIAAFLLLRDHKFQMAELIRVRDVNALSYVWGKYLAVVVLLSGVYLLISCYPTFKFFQICQENDWIFHFWGFFKYTLAWVIPTMMFTVAIGMLIGQLTGSSLIVLVVQLILWFSNITTLSGNYSLGRFIIRFNSSDGYQLLLKSLPALWVNRIFFLIISVICVFLVALIWRHGKKNYVLPS